MLNSKKFIAIVGIFFLGQLALAKNLEIQLKQVGNQPLTVETANLLKMYEDISTMALPLETPRGLTVNFRSAFNGGEFKRQYKSLEVAADYGLGTFPLERKQEFNDAISAHEFGHSIFDYNIERLRPIVAKAILLNSIDKRSSENISQLEKQLENIMNKMENDGSEELSNQYDKLNAELQANRYRSSTAYNLRSEAPYFNIDTRLLAYNEFFADVVAILHSGKPDSMSMAITFLATLPTPEGMEGETPEAIRLNATYRDFAGVEKGVVNANSAHGIFRDTRRHLWKNYIHDARLSRGEILKNVFDAILSEADWLLLNPEMDPMRSGDLVNQRLIKAIDQIFTSRGQPSQGLESF